MAREAGGERGVKARVRPSAFVQYDGRRDSGVALILLQFRSTTGRAADDEAIRDRLMKRLTQLGWESPVLLFRGGHLATAGKVRVVGPSESSEITISDITGMVLYDGHIDLPPIWLPVVQRAGSFGVLACVEADDVDDSQALERLAAEGRLLAAAGRV